MSESLDQVRAAVVDLNLAVYRDVKSTGGVVNPLEVLQRLTLVMLELKTVRELLVEFQCADRHGFVDAVAKKAMVDGYHERLVGKIRAKIDELDAPKVVMLNGSAR